MPRYKKSFDWIKQFLTSKKSIQIHQLSVLLKLTITPTLLIMSAPYSEERYIHKSLYINMDFVFLERCT